MKIDVGQEELNNSLARLGKTIGKRPTLPVLGHVLIKADGEGILLSTTDLEMFAFDRPVGHVEEVGSITVPYRTLKDLIATFPKERVVLSTEEDLCILNIECARTKSHLNGIPAEEYPIFPTWVEDEAVVLSIDQFQQMVGRCAFAAATDESRPMLTAVNLSMSTGQLVMAAADGFRLSVETAESDVQSVAKTVNVPAKTMSTVCDWLARTDVEYDSLAIYLDSSRVVFLLRPGTVIVTQLVAGTFVDYQQIVPKNVRTTVTVRVKEFTKAIKTAQVFAREGASVVHLLVDSAGIMIRGESIEMGLTNGYVDGETKGEDISIAMNASFLLEMLTAINKYPSVQCEFTSPDRAGKFIIPGDDVHKRPGLDWQHVIMPMHIRSR